MIMRVLPVSRSIAPGMFRRRRPLVCRPTNGALFATIGDETGHTNLILYPTVFEARGRLRSRQP